MQTLFHVHIKTYTKAFHSIYLTNLVKYILSCKAQANYKRDRTDFRPDKFSSIAIFLNCIIGVSQGLDRFYYVIFGRVRLG